MHVQEILKAIYDNHHYEYLIIDSDMKIVEYSDKVFDFCELDGHDCETLRVEDAVYELCGMEKKIERVFLGKEKRFTLPYVFKAPDRYVHIHISPGRRNSLPDTNGDIYETVIILFENITELAKMQQRMVQEGNEKALLLKTISEQNHQLQLFNEEMQRLVDEEIRKNLEKQKMLELQDRHSQMGEMISMIIHQWKQPLNAIQLIAQVLKLKIEKDTCSSSDFLLEKLDGIFKQIKFMDQTIYVFQNFFKPAKEKVKFNIYETLESLLELVRYEYEHHDIQIVLKGDKAVEGFGYPNEFSQVILTLMKNAKDAFTEHPSEAMQITLEVRSEEGKACVCVRDNAGGIPEEIIGDIFELYVTTKEDGTGLGLNIAKRVIENNMDGRISVRNTKEGAEFKVLF